jgi:hypothetical protein
MSCIFYAKSIMQCVIIDGLSLSMGCAQKGLENEDECPRQDSNLGSRLRRPVLYPLSYGGVSSADSFIATGKCQVPSTRERKADPS